MRRYETVVIVDPDISEEDRTALLTRTREIIPQQDGVFLQESHWGVKKLAYEIKKKPRGYYVLLDYCGAGKAVDEIERFFRIDDRVMKYMTVQTDQNADPDKILADLAATREKEAAPQETPASAETQGAVADAPAEETAQSDEDVQVDEPAPKN